MANPKRWISLARRWFAGSLAATGCGKLDEVQPRSETDFGDAIMDLHVEILLCLLVGIGVFAGSHLIVMCVDWCFKFMNRRR